MYFDSSALVKLLIEEDDSSLAAQLWDGCDAAVSSQLTNVEVRAALAAAHRDHRITASGLRLATSHWAAYWSSTRQIDLDRELSLQAGQLAQAHSLRGADGVHLASFVAIGVDHCIMATWDRRLRAATMAVGARLAP